LRAGLWSWGGGGDMGDNLIGNAIEETESSSRVVEARYEGKWQASRLSSTR